MSKRVAANNNKTIIMFQIFTENMEYFIGKETRPRNYYQTKTVHFRAHISEFFWLNTRNSRFHPNLDAEDGLRKQNHDDCCHGFVMIRTFERFKAQALNLICMNPPPLPEGLYTYCYLRLKTSAMEIMLTDALAFDPSRLLHFRPCIVHLT